MTGDEIVIVSKSRSRSGIFHTDRDCRLFPDPTREWSRDLAEAWGYEECKVCS